MPRLTPRVSPKSSALTMRTRVTACPSRGGSRGASLPCAGRARPSWSSSMASGTPSLLTPSSSAVRPQRSSDSVKTSLARVNAPSSCAIWAAVSVSRRLIASCSGPGMVENAAVRLISAIACSLDPGRAGVAGRIEPRLEALPGDADGDGPREVHVADRALLGRHGMLARAERSQRDLAHAVVHQQLAPLVVQARRLHGRLRTVAGVRHVGDHLRNHGHDLAAARGAEREGRLAPAEGGQPHPGHPPPPDPAEG